MRHFDTCIHYTMFKSSETCLYSQESTIETSILKLLSSSFLNMYLSIGFFSVVALFASEPLAPKYNLSPLPVGHFPILSYHLVTTILL